LIDRIYPKFVANKLEKSSPAYWAAKSLVHKDDQNIDKGIFSIFFFNILQLSKGRGNFSRRRGSSCLFRRKKYGINGQF
jgi:mannose-6-phosphate isomerase